MHESVFSQTETIVFVVLMMLFACTTLWFWALWIEGVKNGTFYFVKKTSTPLSTGDIAKTKDGRFAIVDHFHTNVFGVMRVKIHFFDTKKKRWMERLYSPSRLTLVAKREYLETKYYLKYGRNPSPSESYDLALQTMGL